MLAARPLKAVSLFLCLRLYFLAFNILWNGSNTFFKNVMFVIQQVQSFIMYWKLYLLSLVIDALYSDDVLQRSL